MDGGPSPLYLETQPDGSILLRGELDVATVEELEKAVTEVMKPGRPVVLDMAQLNFIDSCGVEFLIRTYQVTGERVVICNPSRQVRRLLELMDGGPRPRAWVTQTD